MGIERVTVTSKMDGPCVSFLDWLAERCGGTRSSVNNNIVWACMRGLMQGDIGLHAIALQGLHRDGSYTGFPRINGGEESSLPLSGEINRQARFNFFSRVRLSREVLEVVAYKPLFLGGTRRFLLPWNFSTGKSE